MPSELEAIQPFVEAAATRVTWGISLLGGSLLAFLSTSFTPTIPQKTRGIYFLFIPAWYYLSLCIYLGDSIRQRGAKVALRPDLVTGIVNDMTNEFNREVIAFNRGIMWLAIWLFIYLIVWIASPFFKPKNQTP